MRIYYLKCRPVNHPFPIVAWLIMIFQGMAPWKKESTSHRAISFCHDDAVNWVLDSRGGVGVQKTELIEFQETYKIVEVVKLPLNIDRKEAMTWAQSVLGKKYDKLQVLGLMLKRMFGFITFNSWGKNFRAMICNEVPLHFLIHFGIAKDVVKDPDNWDLLKTDELIDNIKKGLI